MKTGEMDHKRRVADAWCAGRLEHVGRLAARGEREPNHRHKWSLDKLADKLSVGYEAAKKRWQRYKTDTLNAIAAEHSEEAADCTVKQRKGRPDMLTDMVRQLIGNYLWLKIDSAEHVTIKMVHDSVRCFFSSRLFRGK